MYIKRTVRKEFRFTKEEAEDLKRKSERACLSESSLMRLLLKGYEPREQPSKEFYEALSELNAIGNNLNQLVTKANSLGFIDTPMLEQQAKLWMDFQSRVERDYLVPIESTLRWQ